MMWDAMRSWWPGQPDTCTWSISPHAANGALIRAKERLRHRQAMLQSCFFHPLEIGRSKPEEAVPDRSQRYHNHTLPCRVRKRRSCVTSCLRSPKPTDHHAGRRRYPGERIGSPLLFPRMRRGAYTGDAPGVRRCLTRLSITPASPLRRPRPPVAHMQHRGSASTTSLT